MTITLNHTLVYARDRDASARFLTEILGLPAPTTLAHFAIVQIGETSLDYIQTDGEISRAHHAFLVSEAEFDAIFGRIEARKLPYWSDPFHKDLGKINHWDGGRGVYFEDPNGHNLEIITRPYGSGTLDAQRPPPPSV